MSYIAMNTLKIPADMGEMLEQRFAARKGEASDEPGYINATLWRPVKGTDEYYFVMEFDTKENFDAYMKKRAEKKAAKKPSDKPSPITQEHQLFEFETVDFS